MLVVGEDERFRWANASAVETLGTTLEDERETLRSVFENLGAIFLSFLDGPISAANPAACQMLGRTGDRPVP
ncbi:MAG: PAS domain-containing protein [Thermoanaerobaculia bacterium]